MAEKKIWIGLRQGILDKLEVCAASTLKGLCEETGVSYNTAKSRGGDSMSIDSWTFLEVSMRKVSGRGGNRVGL